MAGRAPVAQTKSQTQAAPPPAITESYQAHAHNELDRQGRVIYAAANRMGSRAAHEGIVFKQTPYALEV